MKKLLILSLLVIVAGCKSKLPAPALDDMSFAAARLCNYLKAQPFVPGVPIEQQEMAAAGAVARDTAQRFEFSLEQGANTMAAVLQQHQNGPLAQFACNPPAFTIPTAAPARVGGDTGPARDDERQAANGCLAVMMFFHTPDDQKNEICETDLLVRFAMDLARAKAVVQWANLTGGDGISAADQQTVRETACKAIPETVKNPNALAIQAAEAAAHRVATDFAASERLGCSITEADHLYAEVVKSKANATTTFHDIFCPPAH
ncbi:MAG TPA: hypothetical protein VMU16_15485 [Candidatus Binataceae bacterium]|nr:hypothetical protein [Candidatus Binataceae bacterium]